MAGVYVVRSDGGTAPMARIRCSNEDQELQRVLEKNHDLLPGDQIDPEEPRRWMLIKREMPVPDPGSGFDRWSIDVYRLNESGNTERARNRLKAMIADEVGLRVPDNYATNWVGYPASEWSSKVDSLVDVLGRFMRESRDAAKQSGD